MKKSLLVLVFAVASIFAYSQLVTISGINQIPQIDDTIRYTNASTFGFELAGTGPVTAKVWDYSAMMPGSTTYFYYVDPAETTDAALFPTATIAEGAQGTSGYIYMQAGETWIARKGITGEMYMQYDLDSAMLFHFPITAGGSFECGYTGTLNASSLDMIIDDGNVTMQADAQGTITLPNGTVLTNVLRIHVNETFSGKMDFGTGMTEVMSIVDDYYYWYHEDYKSAIFIYGTTVVESIGGNDETEVLRYQAIEGPSKINKSELSENIFPNPSMGILNIPESYKLNRIEILNINGQVVQTHTPQAKIDISDLSNGIYFVKLTGDAVNEMSKVVLNK
jgi:hypothetical protein